MSQQTASQQIHPTAVVDPKAELASGVVIGPGAVVGPEVVIGENTWIGPHAVLDGRLTLGVTTRCTQAPAWASAAGSQVPRCQHRGVDR